MKQVALVLLGVVALVLLNIMALVNTRPIGPYLRFYIRSYLAVAEIVGQVKSLSHLLSAIT